ncbi:MAG: hypothetical protein AAF542_15360 [Pseudomonadota bacterium]
MRIIFLFIAALLLASCGSDNANQTGPSAHAESAEQAGSIDKTTSDQFDELLDQYYEDFLKLNPLQATFEGDPRYNDQFVNNLDPDVEQSIKATLTRYLSALEKFDDSSLSDSQQMSKGVLEWELGINLDGVAFHNDLMPIDQMWSANSHSPLQCQTVAPRHRLQAGQ